MTPNTREEAEALIRETEELHALAIKNNADPAVGTVKAIASAAVVALELPNLLALARLGIEWRFPTDELRVRIAKKLCAEWGYNWDLSAADEREFNDGLAPDGEESTYERPSRRDFLRLADAALTALSAHEKEET